MQYQSGTKFLDRLQRDLRLDPYLMSPDETMADLFRIAREEMPVETAPAWEKLGFRTHVEPFAYDLMAAFEKSTDKAKALETWNSLTKPPRNEDQWIDLLMRMKVGEFVRFVVSMMP